MSKLFNLKQWLTIEETAKHLSNLFAESVCEADILQLGLDGHLKLSVNFVNSTSAKKGNVVPYRIARRQHFASLLNEEGIAKFLNALPDELAELAEEISQQPSEVAIAAISNLSDGLSEDILHRCDEGSIEGIYIGNSEVLEFESENVYKIEGIWDLPMIGNERIQVEYEYHSKVSGIELDSICLAGAFVTGQGNVMCQIQERFNDKSNELNNYCPASSLPNDSVLVVRTCAISALVDNLQSETEKPKTLSQKEDTTYQNIIVALLDCINGDVSGIEKHPSFKNQSKLIEVIADQYQGYAGLSKRTLEDKFAKAKKKFEL